MYNHDLSRTSLDDWVFSFIHAFRYESNKFSEQEKRNLEPFLKEQTLTRPCQAEIFSFTQPTRVVVLFFFDSTKPDFLIVMSKSRWCDPYSAVKMLIEKYSTLKIRQKGLLRLISSCREINLDLLYSIDFVKNVCCICFTRDPRSKKNLFPRSLNYCNDPQQLAEVIFNLNFDQASTYF